MDETGTKTVALLSVGNTNASLGTYDNGAVKSVTSAPAADSQAVLNAIKELGASTVIFSTVNTKASDEIVRALEKTGVHSVYRVGQDVPIPLRHSLTDDAIARTGQDRLLAAIAAFHDVNQACVVVDAGTAVTVDFIDGEGVFHGGAIAPGATMQLHALSQGTDALPELSPEKPAGDAIGPDTAGAMQRGVHFGIRGLVRMLTEHYAQEYGGYPLVIATGGDAQMLFEGDELVDRVVPELVLKGLARCVAEALEEAAPGASLPNPSDN